MRVSKYKLLEGQTFNIKGLEIKVVKYHKELRISKKSGRKYSAYRLDVQLEGYTDILEISTTSWRKQSFIKRLVKTSVSKEMVIPKITNLYPMPLLLTAPKENTLSFLTWDDFHGIFLDAIKSKDIKEVKRIYRKYAKMYHPDMNKNTNTDIFDNLNSVYEFAKMEVKRPVFNKKDFIEKLKKQ